MNELFDKKMFELGSHRSVIRELFEFGKKRAAELGADKVYDFSLGNPNVPAPECVNRSIIDLISNTDSTEIHGYTSAQGDAATRKAVADNLNRRFGVGINSDLIYMTCGAAASLTVTLRALNAGKDEFVIFAPYFPEYKVFIESAGGVPVTVPFVEPTFQPDLKQLEKSINVRTKAVIVNSPNNPSGVVYTAETIKKIADILNRKSAEYGTTIFIIADEPYREIVYGGAVVPFIPCFYSNTVVCYSYSKSLSLPGERIGYIAVSPNAKQADKIYAAVCGAGRALGYVCAPSLMQKVVARCADALPDVKAYAANRDLLYNTLTEIGYECVRPDGAFYLFVKSLEKDANAFSERAKNFGLLLVPGDSFAANGYIRAAYCVSNDMIKRSLPAFKELFDSYKK